MERRPPLAAVAWTALTFLLLMLGDAANLPAGETLPGDNGQRVLSSRRAPPKTQVRFIPAAQPPQTEGATAQPENDPAGAKTADDNDLRPIDEIDLVIGSPEEKLPPDYAALYFERAGVDRQFPGTSRPWGMSLESWEATALCHRPLYFEEVNLERYGKSFGIAQPAVSAVDMFGRVLVLPYLVGATRPRECVYTLGHGRPGNYMPFYLHRPRVSLRGGLLQATTVTGMAFIVP